MLGSLLTLIYKGHSIQSYKHNPEDRVMHDLEAVSLLESLGTKWYELFDGLVSFEELLSDYL